MTFEEVLDQTIKMLQRRDRVSFRALRRQFNIDDEYIEDIRYELTQVQRLAIEEDGGILVWNGGEIHSSSEFPTDTLLSKKRNDDRKRDSAERRQLTVMFIDLVGSTQLSQLLDPEDFREVLYQYQDICDHAVTINQGIVMQHSGDGIVVYFGYPIAHENDPRRAIMSGLSMLRSLDELNKNLITKKNISLQIRIGVHTGLVVVGATGGRAHSEMTAIGEVPNLAARIQNVAEPGTIVISEATNKLIKDYFETKPAGEFTLKGFNEPIELYLVKEERKRESVSLTLDDNINILVGRESERMTILDKWQHASKSKGQVVLISGEAGIGKSFLARSLASEIASQNVPYLTFKCSPFHRNTAFQPIVDTLLNEITDAQGKTNGDKINDLEIYLKNHGLTEPYDLAICASLLSLPLPSHLEDLNISLERRKALTFTCIVRWLLATKSPKLVLIEDLHWADPSTLDLLDRIIDQIPFSPVLLLATFRPEFKSTWEVGSYIHQINLKHLNNREAEAMINQVARNLPIEVVNDLLRKTDGNPLFIEEVTKFVLESGVVEESKGAYKLKGSLNTISIPNTLQDSLMARLDQVGPAKEVAQIGATIGREFSKSLIRAISNLDDDTLNDYLVKLVKAQLLFVNDNLPNAVYTFKHALIQEAAYSSLLKKRRQEFHKRIVENLEQKFHDIVQFNPELLAHHCSKANLLEEAVPYWRRAGELAISRSAHTEAINYLNEGLFVLKGLPETQQHVSDEILFQIALGVPLTALRGYGSVEVEQAYARARSLCQKAGETWQLIPALYGLWRYYLLRAQYKEALELSNQILNLSKHSKEAVHLVVGHRSSGSTNFYLGKFDKAIEHFNKIFAIPTTKHSRAGTLLYDVVDAWVTAKSYASLTFWIQGYPDQAMRHSQEAIAMAERLKHPFSRTLSLSFAAWLHQFQNEEKATLESAKSGLQIAEENGFSFWVGWGKILEGWAKEENGSDLQVKLIQEGLETWYATGSELGTTYFLFLLGQSLLKNGNIQAAWQSLERAKQFVEITGEKWWESELYRLEGLLHLASEYSGHKQAEQSFRHALKIASLQKAKSLELRAATSLGKLLMNTSANDEAYSILKQVVDWFKEGFQLGDMLEAEATLKKLSETMA